MIHRLTHEELTRLRATDEQAAATSDRTPMIAIVENVRSLYNVGSIFRTADAGRLEAIFTVGYTPYPPRPEIDKTALGATRTVPTKHFPTVRMAIEESRLRGMRVAALELARESRSVFTLTKADFPLAFVVGSEVTGVSDEALDICDLAIAIPMLGAKHSLNVAVAFGVVVYEGLRALSDDLERYRAK